MDYYLYSQLCKILWFSALSGGKNLNVLDDRSAESWLNEFTKRMLLIMEVLKFLVSESGNILWLNFEDKELSGNLINELIEKFNQLNQNYTSSTSAT